MSSSSLDTPASIGPAVEAQPLPATLDQPRRKGRVAWMTLLLFAICFEGLGRKFLPFIPSTVFYFLKDAVLLLGLVAYGIRPSIVSTARRLYGPFLTILVLAIAWTVVEVFNPDQQSLVLGLVGLRSYWFWWLAPLVIASALEDPRDFRGVVIALAVVSVVVAAFALFQFSRPSDDPLNAYASFDGETTMEVTTVASTGRARVSSTFSYISGLADFVSLAPTLLLSVGLREEGMIRWLSLLGAAASAAAAPTTGSRGPLVAAGMGIIVVAWSAGLLKTTAGRRIVIGTVVIAAAAVFVQPEAFEGVQERFVSNPEETSGRFIEAFRFLPPVALLAYNYPAFGIGTGMQHNSRFSFGVPLLPDDAEGEFGRFLIELGVVGYLLVWLARLGLGIALFKASRQLHRAGERGFAGLAIAYALLLMVSPVVFDHIWQALFFVGVGLVLRAAAVVNPVLPLAEPPPRDRRRAPARL